MPTFYFLMVDFKRDKKRHGTLGLAGMSLQCDAVAVLGSIHKSKGMRLGAVSVSAFMRIHLFPFWKEGLLTGWNTLDNERHEQVGDQEP